MILFARLRPLSVSILVATMIAVLVPAGSLFAQASFTATVDRQQITTDETVMLTLEVISESAAPVPPTLPEMPGLTMIGRSDFARMTVRGGEVRRSSTYQFQLEPNQIGRLTIPAIELSVDGQTLRSEAIEILVEPGTRPTMAPPSSSARTSEAPYSVEAVVDNARPFVGEALAFIFRLNQRVRLSGRLSYVSPDFEGFLDKFDPQQQARDLRVGGRPMRVTEIRTLLFPISAGPLEIDAARLDFGGFGFESNSLETEPVKIDVRPLPEGAPAGFDGAVGRYEIAAGLRENMQPRVGEPIPFVVRIEGEGNIEAVTEPRWPELPDGWRSYEGAVGTDLRNAEGRVEGRRSFERMLVPSTAGRVDLPPIEFSFFDPDTERYETVATEPIAFSIEASTSGVDLADEDRSLTVEDSPALRSVTLLAAPASNRVSPLGLLILFGLLPLTLFGIDGLQRSRESLRRASMAEGPHPALAEATLAVRGEASNAEPGPRTLRRALETYLEARMQCRITGLAQADVLRLLQTNGIDEGLRERLGRALAELDLALAARSGLGTSSHPEALIALIEDLEAAWPA